MKVFQLIFLFLFSTIVLAQESRELVADNPDAVVDLRTHDGIQLLSTEWRYSDADIVDDRFGAPGPSGDDPLPLYPTGPKQATWNIEPKAGGADYDDSSWEVLDPTSLEERRCPGLSLIHI